MGKGEEGKRRETGVRMAAIFSSHPVVVPKFIPKWKGQWTCPQVAVPTTLGLVSYWYISNIALTLLSR